jgi:hypothetical protein
MWCAVQGLLTISQGEAIAGAHEPHLTCLVARVEEVPPVIRGRREIHGHDAALLVRRCTAA